MPTAFQVVTIGDGRPVIFIPGLGCHGRVWYGISNRFEHIQAMTLTPAGFAGQPAIDGPLARTMVQQLARYIRDRKIVKPVIVGHSMGGFVALWLAATEPDLVGPVVVVDSVPGNDAASAARGKQLRDRWAKLPRPQLEQTLRSYYSGMFTNADDRDAVIEDVLKSDQRALADAVEEVFTVDLVPELPKVTAPVLAILADGPHQRTIKQQLAAVPDHQFVVLPKTRHFVMKDDPDGFYRALDAFMAAHR